MKNREIIKGLEICGSGGGCYGCPYKCASAKCINDLLKDAYKLIQSLVAEKAGVNND